MGQNHCRVGEWCALPAHLLTNGVPWQAVVSLCQVIFMLTRAPRVAWEAIYLPLCETITYFLAFTGNGYLRMADGQIFPWARMASWLVTCPVMLGQ
eukprot:3303314-Rhodomonas_salina.1